jgi:hypothetical protein
VTETRLARCDLAACEAMCCYDGVYLRPGEEARLVATVAAHPDFFGGLPGPFVVDGVWQDRIRGRKTAVRPHVYASPAYPPHFAPTRCVFALADGRCSLQALAVRLGEHPWARKPRACWLHPLREGPEGPRPPPVDPRDDPDRQEPAYPGFATSTACGRHRPDGLPWREALAPELAHLAEQRLTERAPRSARDRPARA